MVCFFAMSLMGGEVCAGGWPLAPGSGEIITSITWLSADERYNADGNKRSTSRYTKLEIAPYAEYGLLENLTLIGEAAYTSEETDYFGYEFSNAGLSRLKAGARIALGTWKETLYSLQPLITLHLMENGNDPAATRSGDVDTEFGIVMARSDMFYGMNIFSVQEVAYRYRDRQRPDEARADVTLGIKPWPDIMFLLKSLNTVALKSTANDELYQSSKLGFSTVHTLPRHFAPGWSAETGIEQTIIGRSTIEETVLRFAIWYSF
ncbi:hypothetical protein [Parvibaculum lavamentivorans]|nr:hypothetical protein [Parvibaculum lavamentivorans]